MRRLLGVLRRETDGGSSERAPQPGIGQLGELLDQARSAGLPVSFTAEGVPLPGGAALAAYRIVQESLGIPLSLRHGPFWPGPRWRRPPGWAAPAWRGDGQDGAGPGRVMPLS